MRWLIVLMSPHVVTPKTRNPLNISGLSMHSAEEEGFEPPEPRGSTVFKTAAFDRSATPLWTGLSTGLQM